MSKIIHDDSIEWPNGKGYTPCTKEYADMHAEMQRIKSDDENLDDLEPDAYNRYCTLDNDLGALQLEGHLGKGVQY